MARKKLIFAMIVSSFMGGFLALGSFMLLQPNPEPIIVPVSNDETIHSAALTSYQLDTTLLWSPKASTS